MHNIMEHDAGVIAFTGKLGKSWHGVESYRHFDEQVPFTEVAKVGDYEVEKKPLYLQDGRLVDGAYALYREDVGQVLFPSVGDRYAIIQNAELTQFVDDSILKPYGNIEVESAGTLENGRHFFVNLIVTEHTVAGDISPTVTRLMFTNTFGGLSLNACLHQTRIVCQNTLRVAGAQGKANQTLKAFRHTKNASTRMQSHILNLADIIGEVRIHNKCLDYLATQQIKSQDVDILLENLFPTELLKDQESTRSVSMNRNKQQHVRQLYETKEDLIVLPHSRYRLLNAVTDWSSNSMSLKGEVDFGKRLMSSIDGTADQVNQKALQLLVA